MPNDNKARSLFVPILGSVFALACALTAPAQKNSGQKTQWKWTAADRLRVGGRAFDDRAATFDRLPARAEAEVRKQVWDLSRHSAGISVRFRTAATRIAVRWTLTDKRLAMPHMAATGVSGVDLYVRHDERWRWLATGRPKALENRAVLARGIDPMEREFMLYLPLYNGTKSLEIGVPPETAIEPGAAPKHGRPIVFYGTSITQGACASRPGMTHPAILGRRLDREVINLGFSGQGRMELALAKLIAEVDAAVYVVDCLPNLDGKKVEARLGPLVDAIRAKRPDTPIVLVEDRTYADGFLKKGRAMRNQKNRAALRAGIAKLRARGVTGLHTIDGETLLAKDGDSTVDGSHPTDLGFAQQANAFEPLLRQLLSADQAR